MIDGLAAIVRRVGAELLALRGTAAAQGEWDGTQLKTESDLRAHRLIVDGLACLAPDLAVVSEEDVESHTEFRADRYFIIDPIDGTASFTGGFCGYVTQVALIEAGRLAAAAIYAPATDQLYLAERGRGATLNGRRLTVENAVERTVLIDNYPEPRGTAARAYTDLNATGYMECGSISLKICRVADSTADLFFKDVVVRDWDIAAPHLVIEEAGGVLTGTDSGPFVYYGPYEKTGVIAAATPALATAMSGWLERQPTAPTAKGGRP